MKLSTKLKNYRADRPDEWSMDEFARQAERLETLLFEASEQIYDLPELEKKIQDELD